MSTNRGVSETIKTRQGVTARVTLWRDGSIDLEIESNIRERYPLVALSFAPREAAALRDWLASDVAALVKT